MTAKADFTAEEWKEILEAPPSAAMMVITAQRGGTIRETFSMAKAYAETRKQHGKSELLDEIVAAKPEIDPPAITRQRSSRTTHWVTCALRCQPLRARPRLRKASTTSASSSV